MTTATVKSLEDLRALAVECGVGHWSIGTDYMPTSAAADHRDREIGCVVIRVNAGRTERFVSPADAAAFIRAELLRAIGY